MRILKRLLAKLPRTNRGFSSALGGCLAASVVLASSAAPAQPPPPGRPAPAKPAPGKPANPAPGNPTQPAPANPPPDAAAGPAAPGAAAQPAPADAGQKGDEPLVPAPEPAPPPAKAAPQTPAAAVDPEKDTKSLIKLGGERPTTAGEIGARPSDVFAEDWWSQARPVFEIHGYYRVRAELFHKFALGRVDPTPLFWPQPADNDFVDAAGNPHLVKLCGDIPRVKGQLFQGCSDNTQAGANMRFRISPELHISDNLRVMSQIDLLDNVVLGSTPEGYSNVPVTGGYTAVQRGGATPLGAFSSTQWTPVAGQNSLTNSISVKRVWGEYTTPVGVLYFGRMPSHWGLGILANRGDGYDSDYQSTADRIMLVTGVKRWDLYFGGAYDFANEGATSAMFSQQQGQPYDLNQLDDVNQYVLFAARRRNPELQKLELAKGQAVINGGVYFVFRNQVLANDESSPSSSAALGQSSSSVSAGLVRRGAKAYIPDLWFQFLYKKFRFEVEATGIMGSIESTHTVANSGTDYVNPDTKGSSGWKIRQFGVATESEFRALEDKLHIQFGFGYATGDPDVASLSPGNNGLQPQLTSDRTFSMFRFHPDYRVDLILHRHLLNGVAGSYYLRPAVDYDFARDKNGQRLGGGAAMIWSRASQFIQAPGHARDLGIELNFQIYYQAKDGTLNDNPDKMGGFYTMLQYGVLFPLGGMNYLEGEKSRALALGQTIDTSTAQTLRWFLGVLY